jgi:hypothetical protein
VDAEPDGGGLAKEHRCDRFADSTGVIACTTMPGRPFFMCTD